MAGVMEVWIGPQPLLPGPVVGFFLVWDCQVISQRWHLLIDTAGLGGSYLVSGSQSRRVRLGGRELWDPSLTRRWASFPDLALPGPPCLFVNTEPVHDGWSPASKIKNGNPATTSIPPVTAEVIPSTTNKQKLFRICCLYFTGISQACPSRGQKRQLEGQGGNWRPRWQAMTSMFLMGDDLQPLETTGAILEAIFKYSMKATSLVSNLEKDMYVYS